MGIADIKVLDRISFFKGLFVKCAIIVYPRLLWVNVVKRTEDAKVKKVVEEGNLLLLDFSILVEHLLDTVGWKVVVCLVA